MAASVETHRVFIKGLPSTVFHSQLEPRFGLYGSFRKSGVYHAPGMPSVAFIDFEGELAAIAAVENENDSDYEYNELSLISRPGKQCSNNHNATCFTRYFECISSRNDKEEYNKDHNDVKDLDDDGYDNDNDNDNNNVNDDKDDNDDNDYMATCYSKYFVCISISQNRSALTTFLYFRILSQLIK